MPRHFICNSRCFITWFHRLSLLLYLPLCPHTTICHRFHQFIANTVAIYLRRHHYFIPGCFTAANTMLSWLAPVIIYDDLPSISLYTFDYIISRRHSYINFIIDTSTATYNSTYRPCLWAGVQLRPSTFAQYNYAILIRTAISIWNTPKALYTAKYYL
jgi:hypothetical protein